MDPDTKKIMVACFIGATIGTVVAFAVTPVYWWLGLIAGFPGGYLAYEFRKIGPAMKIAYRETTDKGSGVSNWFIRTWFQEPYPMGHVSLMPAALGTFLLYLMILLTANPGFIVVSILCSPIIFYFAFVMVFFLVATLAHKGSMREKMLPYIDPFKPWDSEREKLLEQGYIEVDATYRRLLRWGLVGILDIILSVLSSSWWLIKFPFKFGWMALRLIHSHKRLLCGVDSSIGVAAAYLIFHSSVDTSVQHFAVSVFGGLIGAGWGMLNWEIVSKRILGLAGQE